MSSLEMLTLLELAHGRLESLTRTEGQPLPMASRVRAAIRGLAAFGRRSLLLAVLLATWEAMPRLGLIDPTFLPPFSDVIAAGWQLAQTGELYDDVSASLLRALSGFLIAVTLIVPLGRRSAGMPGSAICSTSSSRSAAIQPRWHCCPCSSCCSESANCRRSRW